MTQGSGAHNEVGIGHATARGARATGGQAPVANTRRIGGMLLLLGLLCACAHQVGSPPVIDRTTDAQDDGTSSAAAGAPQLPRAQPLHDGLPPDGHVVQPGDTLYGIAWRYGVDYRAVARLNHIDPPYRIRVGQHLLLADPNGGAMAGPAVAATGAASGAQPEMVPAEPSNRGFEYVPDTPAGAAPQEVWQDMPPPTSAAPGVAVAPAPGIATQTLPPASMPAPASAPVLPPSTPIVPPDAPVGSAAQSAGAPAGGLPAGVGPTGAAPTGAPTAGGPTVAALPPQPAPTAPLDELPPETLGTAPQSPAPVVPAPAAEPAPAPARSAGGGVGAWRWPTGGAVEKGFGNGNKGIDFRLVPGKPVVAAGGGEVVYAGNGLGGFRHLVIVKHDQRFLSAYSLNWPIAVKEGERIDSGATIATAEGAGASTLRFEIRRDGQPVDPVSVIKR